MTVAYLIGFKVRPQQRDRFMRLLTGVLDVQLARPYRQAWHEALPELLDGARDVSIWSPIRSDRRD